MRNKYQRKDRKSNHKFEIVRGQELLVRVPLPMAEVWAEMQAQVEELTGQAGLQILRAILENEVTHRVGPPHRPHPAGGCVRWGKQPGYVVFAGQKIPYRPGNLACRISWVPGPGCSRRAGRIPRPLGEVSTWLAGAGRCSRWSRLWIVASGAVSCRSAWDSWQGGQLSETPVECGPGNYYEFTTVLVFDALETCTEFSQFNIKSGR